MGGFIHIIFHPSAYTHKRQETHENNCEKGGFPSHRASPVLIKMEKIEIKIEIQDNGQTSMQKINNDLHVLLKSVAVCKFDMTGQDKVMSYKKGDMNDA